MKIEFFQNLWNRALELKSTRRSSLALHFQSMNFGDWIYSIFFWVTVVAAIVLNVRIPLPGYAIAFLAVAAFIATFRDNISNAHKLIWCIAMLGLFMAEIRAIRLDKEEQASADAERRSSEDARFKETLGKFQETLHGLSTLKNEAELQDLWTKEGLAQSIEQGAVPYARAYSDVTGPCVNGKEIHLGLVESGKLPIQDVSGWILGLNMERKQFSVPILHPSTADTVIGKIPGPGIYLVELKTRYNECQEGLSVLPNSEGSATCKQTISVLRYFDGKTVWQCCPPKDCLKQTCTENYAGKVPPSAMQKTR